MKTAEFHTYTLPNGIRGIHRQVQSGVAHCALLINSGSRDERAGEYGLAHFTEHALFKGTRHRRAYHINCRLENLGGELNAYTTKEETAVHATVLRGDVAKAAELIGDVVFHATFPERELEREREVVADEINAYKDAPSEMIYDTFEEMLFEGSELGHNILGRKSSLPRYDAEAIRRFTARTFTTDQMVFSSIGNLSPRRIEAVAMRYLARQSPSERAFERLRPQPVAPFTRSVNKHLHQAHCILGASAYDLSDERRLPLSLLVNLLGGPSANSLLNVTVRERNGLSYCIEASYTPFTDCGVATIYFATDRDKVERCLQLVQEQLVRLRTQPLTPRQLATAKRQFLGQVAISMESNESNMLGAGKSYLVYGRVEPLAELENRIGGITAAQLMQIADEIFARPSTLIYR